MSRYKTFVEKQLEADKNAANSGNISPPKYSNEPTNMSRLLNKTLVDTFDSTTNATSRKTLWNKITGADYINPQDVVGQGFWNLSYKYHENDDLYLLVNIMYNDFTILVNPHSHEPQAEEFVTLISDIRQILGLKLNPSIKNFHFYVLWPTPEDYDTYERNLVNIEPSAYKQMKQDFVSDEDREQKNIIPSQSNMTLVEIAELLRKALQEPSEYGDQTLSRPDVSYPDVARMFLRVYGDTLPYKDEFMLLTQYVNHSNRTDMTMFFARDIYSAMFLDETTVERKLYNDFLFRFARFYKMLFDAKGYDDQDAEDARVDKQHDLILLEISDNIGYLRKRYNIEWYNFMLDPSQGKIELPDNLKERLDKANIYAGQIADARRMGNKTVSPDKLISQYHNEIFGPEPLAT